MLPWIIIAVVIALTLVILYHSCSDTTEKFDPSLPALNGIWTVTDSLGNNYGLRKLMKRPSTDNIYDVHEVAGGDRLFISDALTVKGPGSFDHLTDNAMVVHGTVVSPVHLQETINTRVYNWVYSSPL